MVFNPEKILKNWKMNYPEKLLIDLIENWNDSNTIDRLNPDLIRLIGTYLEYSYTIGGEQMKKEILKRMELIADVNGIIRLKIALKIIEKL